MNNLVAFAGCTRSGKSTASKALVELGFKRVAFGSIIKRQVDPLVQKHIGFSAFTEIDSEKALIRGMLEQWGEANYKNILKEFFDTLPGRAVNERIVRTDEAQEWVRRGGVIIELRRPGFGPATQWEKERLEELRASGLIDHTIQAEEASALVAAVVEFVTGPSPRVPLLAA